MLKSNHIKKFGILLLSHSILLMVQNNVWADELVSDNSLYSEDISINKDSGSISNANGNLTQVLEEAKQVGLTVVEIETQVFDYEKQLLRDYQTQVQQIKDEVVAYQEAKQTYAQEFATYKDYEKREKQYQEDLQSYKVYLTQVEDYQKEEQKYQLQLEEY